MARDFIKIDRASAAATHATLLLSLVNQARGVYELANRIKDIMTRNNDGSNFSDIESLFGLPAGKGQIVFDLVNGTTGSMIAQFQTDDFKELTERLG